MSTNNIEYNSFKKDELDDLLIKAKNGSTSAFDELASVIRSISYSYFKSKYNYGKLKSVDDADDLTNDIFLSFAKQYQDIDEIERWLRRVMFLSFVNFYKKERSKKFYRFDEAFFDNKENYDAEKNIDAQSVAALIDNLKDPKDKIIRMRFWDELKFSEIAEKLNKSESAVKKMFYRSLVEIKKMLE